MNEPESKTGAQAIARHVKHYVAVWAILLIGMLLAVWLNALQLESRTTTITLTLLISTVSAVLVGFVLMHLSTEKKTVFALLLITLFCFSFMMYLTVWAHGQRPPGTVYFGAPSQPAAPEAPGGK